MSLSLLATSTVPSSSLVNPLRSNTKKRSPVCFGKGVAYTSCEHKQSKEEDNHTIDRRNVLLGLGGLYGASATIGTQGEIAVGAPIAPPDLSKCTLAFDEESKEPGYCCPPYSTADVKPFVPPTDGILRIRKPAHKLKPRQIEDFERGIQLMKELPPTDPWNFYQQASIHCAFCNNAFYQVGFPDTRLQVHGSWLFIPWHRYYIYFWEKILGKLLNDPNFAIPYWSWDSPEGMFIPEMYYKDENSPLYNGNRNHDHLKALLDYDWAFKAPNPTPEQYEEVKIRNLKKIEKILTDNISKPSSFLGDPLIAGQVIKDNPGGLESLHNLIHQWVGPEAKPNHDMGNFFTAARDTMFFGLHANVDRLWDIYGALRGNKVEFNEPDWLDASFIFYDENRQVVNCKVRDCLVSENLGYTYAMEPQAWKTVQKTYKELQRRKKRSAGESLSLSPVSEFGSAPRALNSTIRVLVHRPKVSRSKDEKEEFVEVVVVDGIKFGHGDSAKFDVYVAKPIEGLVGPDLGELAGSFVRLAHTHTKKGMADASSKIELVVNKLLDDIEAEASESLVVSLVPRNGDVTIGGVHIYLFESDI